MASTGTPSLSRRSAGEITCQNKVEIKIKKYLLQEVEAALGAPSGVARELSKTWQNWHIETSKTWGLPGACEMQLMAAGKFHAVSRLQGGDADRAVCSTLDQRHWENHIELHGQC